MEFPQLKKKGPTNLLLQCSSKKLKSFSKNFCVFLEIKPQNLSSQSSELEKGTGK